MSLSIDKIAFCYRNIDRKFLLLHTAASFFVSVRVLTPKSNLSSGNFQKGLEVWQKHLSPASIILLVPSASFVKQR